MSTIRRTTVLATAALMLLALLVPLSGTAAAGVSDANFTSSSSSVTRCDDPAAGAACPPPVASADVAKRTASFSATIDKTSSTVTSKPLEQRAASSLKMIDSLDTSVSWIEYTIRVRVDQAQVSAASPDGYADSWAAVSGNAGCSGAADCGGGASHVFSSSSGGTEAELHVVARRPDALISGDVTLGVGVVGGVHTHEQTNTIGWCVPWSMGCIPVEVGTLDHTNGDYTARAHASAAVTVLSVAATYGRTPLAPQALTATGREEAVDLSWNAAPSPLPLIGYRVYRHDVLVADETVLGPTATRFHDAPLAPSSYYHYRVEAVNAEGVSEPAFATAITYGTPSAPTLSASTGYCAVPIDTSAGIDAVNLSWSRSAGATYYVIERKTGAGDFKAVGSVSGYDDDTAEWTDCEVAGGTTYSYRVIAVAQSWDRYEQSEPSNVVTVTTGNSTDLVGLAPGAPTATATGVDMNTVRVRWTPAPAKTVQLETLYFNVYVDGRGIVARVPATATTWDDTTLAPVEQRTYYVSAVSAAGEGARSNAANAQSLSGKPDAPSYMSASDNSITRRADINLAWYRPSDNGSAISSYRLHRVGPGGERAVIMVKTSACDDSGYCRFIDTSVTRGGSYTYRVAAVNANGEGALSSPATATA